MNLLKFIAQIILIVLIYRLIVYFVIPTYRNISRFRKQFRQVKQELHQRFKEQHQSNGQFRTHTEEPATKKNQTIAPKEGEYIEFEEIKSGK